MPSEPPAAASPYTRANPFPGKLVVNRSLCGEDSEKDTRHFEIDLTGWGLNYEVGDSMTVWPTKQANYRKMSLVPGTWTIPALPAACASRRLRIF